MSRPHTRTIVPTQDGTNVTVLWFDPSPVVGDFTLSFVPRDAELKARLAYVIKRAREDAQLSRPELASLVGVGRGAVNAWEKGDSVPSLLNLGALCDALQVDADLFAHPPAVPESPVAKYRLRAVQAADAAVDEALKYREYAAQQGMMDQRRK